MKCPNCGRENAEEVNFCYYCGYSFREHSVVSGMNTENVSQDVFSQAPDVAPYSPVRSGEAGSNSKNDESNTAMAPWKWALYFLMLCIPYLWIVWLVVTIVWVFSEKSSPERRNFAKGLLAFIVGVLVFSILTAIILIATMGTDGAINYLTGGVATNADALMKMYGVQ